MKNDKYAQMELHEFPNPENKSGHDNKTSILEYIIMTATTVGFIILIAVNI